MTTQTLISSVLKNQFLIQFSLNCRKILYCYIRQTVKIREFEWSLKASHIFSVLTNSFLIQFPPKQRKIRYTH